MAQGSGKVEPLDVVGVMGSGTDAHAEKARPLGRFLARAGVHLLTGGGGGVMAAVSEAFCATSPRRGLSIGVLPANSASDVAPAPGYPNPHVELAIHTHLHRRGAAGDAPDSRNHVNVLSAHVLVFLPGGEGTTSEARLAARYGRRAIAWHAPGDPAPPSGIERAASFEELTERLRGWLRLEGG